MKVSQTAGANTTRLERAGELASRAASLRPTDPNLRRGLHAGIAVVVVLGVGLAVAALLDQFPDQDWRFDPAALGLGVLGFTILLLYNAELWRRLLKTLGHPVQPARSTAIWCMSALGRYVPTSALLPVMRVAMSEREGVPKRICFVSIAYEGALAFTAALAVGAYFVVDLPALSGQPERFLAPVLPVVALVILQPRIFHPLADWALKKLGRRPLPLALAGRDVLEFMALFALSFLLAGLSVYALAAGIYPVDRSDIVTVTGAFAAATTLSVLTFMLPGGLVAREAGLVVALSPVMPTAPALGVAVLARIVQLGLELLLAMVTPVLARFRGSSMRPGRPRPARPPSETPAADPSR